MPTRFTIPAAALLFTLFSGCSKSDNPTLPSASVAGVRQDRTTVTSPFQFTVTLTKTSTQEVSIHYTTVAGTALENVDFLPSTGTLTIPAGQKSASLTVQVTGDSTRKANQIFHVQLDNPTNCTLAGDNAIGTIVNENGLYFPVATAGYSTPDNYSGYTLTWSDEFDGNQINTNNWGYDIGNNGWGNHELENYTNNSHNSFVSQGNLIIEARLENVGGSSYTSARMLTKSRKSFEYGRIDIRAKLPIGKGIWPALWLLGDNIDQVGWPTCGEMDMMELLGQEPAKVYGTLHWGPAHQSTGTNYTLGTGSFNDQFHVFSMTWRADSVKMFVDDQQFFANPNTPNYPFNSTFFFIFNVAVGGDWPGAPDGNTQFPQRMIVDYVRVFQE